MVDEVAKRAPKSRFRFKQHGTILRAIKQKLGNPKS